MKTYNTPPEKIHREVYLDYLRVIACFSVIILHVSAQNWDSVDVNTVPWQVFNFFDGAVRWTVPVFVMVSGALFLNPAKEISIKSILQKYTFRIVCAFVFWSFLYAVKEGLVSGFRFNLVKQFIAGHYHMGFLFMIVGLYLITPLVRCITADQKATKYFLILCLFCTFLLPRFLSLGEVFQNSMVTEMLEDGRKLYEKVDFHFTLGFVGYFVLGFYLSRNSVPLSFIRWCGVLGFSAVIGLSAILCVWKHEPTEYFYSYLSAPVLMESIFVFCYVKRKIKDKSFSRLDRIVHLLSNYSFGIYLVHAFIIEVFSLCGLDTLSFFPGFSVPLLASMVFLISALISAVLHHIPILRKYVV